MNYNIAMEKTILKIKPHHFLDFLYDLATDNRHDEPNPNESDNGRLCCGFIDGKFARIVFTPFVDDICRPCNKLIDGKRCIDHFDDVTTMYYGFRYKNDFNYHLDIELHAALPSVFLFNVEQDMIDVLISLKEKLTNDIINLYLWKRSEREKNTFLGIEKAIAIYQKIK